MNYGVRFADRPTYPASFQCACGGWVRYTSQPNCTIPFDMYGIQHFACPQCGADFGRTHGSHNKPSLLDSPKGGVYAPRFKVPEPKP